MMAKLMAKNIAVLSSSNSTTKKIEQSTTMFRPFYGRILLFCILKVRLLDCHLPIGWTNQLGHAVTGGLWPAASSA